MPDSQVNVIVNPNADLGRAYKESARLLPLIEHFSSADWTGTVYPKHATLLARQAALSGYQLIVAVGGDGTVHEVVNGLMQVPISERPKLGIIPFGSGNDFAHAIGIKSTSETAIEQIFTGRSTPVDVGCLTDGNGREEYWVNAVGIGFDTAVTIRFRKLRILRGFSAYLVAVLQTIMLDHDAPRMQVVTDQEDWDQRILMLVSCNGSREGGGFLVAPQAKPNDGIFHYAAVEYVSRLMMLRLVPEVMRGTHDRFRQVRMGQFHKLSLQADRPLSVHMDGEILSDSHSNLRQLELKVVPAAIEVIS